jgi:hypothetical protein
VIEIFVGSLIEDGSERAVLERAVQVLEASNQSAIIFVSLNLSRQIDLIIALEQLTLVIEVKGFSVPVRGNQNGKWEYRVASGWTYFSSTSANPYDQTNKARNALRDEMARFARIVPTHPSAALVFCPSIPRGSSISAGDFKVAIVGLDAIETQLARVDDTQWTFDQWRAFAKYLRLTPVSTIQAAFNPQIAAAEDLIATYVDTFRRTYQPLAAELISFMCTDANGVIASGDVVKAGVDGVDLLLQGPSGCGKTMLAYLVALHCISQGRVPVFVRAKNFQSSFRDLVNQEVTLLDTPSTEALFSSCRRMGRGLALIIDGYNECTASLRERLTRIISAASRRYKASVVVTTRIPLESSQLLQLENITILLPTMSIKRAIAEQASGRASIGPSLLPLLSSVYSGLEARLIGEVERSIPPGASHYAVFDKFVRHRLGEEASNGISTLAWIAGLLSDRVSFSLSVRDLERFSEQDRVPTARLQQLYDAGLLAKHGDRISFEHELYLNAFGAESIVRRGMKNAAWIAFALCLAQNGERRTLILGAIDDHDLLQAVLERVTDTNVIQSCLAGNCGVAARLWAEAGQASVVARLHEEISKVSFEICDDYPHVRADPQTLLSWTTQDRAFIGALLTLTDSERSLASLLGLADAIDERLFEEHQRLRDQVNEQNIALRSELFAACYVQSWEGLAAAQIFEPIHRGMIDFNYSLELATMIRAYLTKDNMSPGKIYLLIALYRKIYIFYKCIAPDAPSLAALLPRLLRENWRVAARHLRQHLLYAAMYCGREATDDERRELIEALRELPPPQNSTMLVDALKALGALDDEEAQHTAAVRRDISEVLANQDNVDMQQLAFNVWSSQFDHPFEGAYCEAVSELAPTDKKKPADHGCAGNKPR